MPCKKKNNKTSFFKSPLRKNKQNILLVLLQDKKQKQKKQKNKSNLHNLLVLLLLESRVARRSLVAAELGADRRVLVFLVVVSIRPFILLVVGKYQTFVFALVFVFVCVCVCVCLYVCPCPPCSG